jgi:hypothetical protein
VHGGWCWRRVAGLRERRGRHFNRLNTLANFSRHRGREAIMPVENRRISSNVA